MESEELGAEMGGMVGELKIACDAPSSCLHLEVPGSALVAATIRPLNILNFLDL